MGYRGESGNTGKETSLLNEFTNESINIWAFEKQIYLIWNICAVSNQN